MGSKALRHAEQLAESIESTDLEFHQRRLRGDHSVSANTELDASHSVVRRLGARRDDGPLRRSRVDSTPNPPQIALRGNLVDDGRAAD